MRYTKRIWSCIIELFSIDKPDLFDKAKGMLVFFILLLASHSVHAEKIYKYDVYYCDTELKCNQANTYVKTNYAGQYLLYANVRSFKGLYFYIPVITEYYDVKTKNRHKIKDDFVANSSFKNKLKYGYEMFADAGIITTNEYIDDF